MRRRWVRETAGWLFALAIALVTTAIVASTSRGDLLFRDGDSLVVAMLARAQLTGSPTDWALSSVLFLPETTVFTAIDAVTGADLDAMLAISAVLNLLALYGAIRVVAGRRRTGAAPVAWSVTALAVFGGIAATETSGSRDGLELASMTLTTTYYSATVIAVVLSIGIARRTLDRERGTILMPAILGLIAAVSTLTNPLYAVWGALPLVLLLGATAYRRRHRARAIALIAALSAGVAVGLIARIPFAAWIANTGVGYAQPARWAESLGYYADLLVVRASSVEGVLAILAVIALIVMAAISTIRADGAGSRLVAASAWFIPLSISVGAIALGTHAARYLQPVVFAAVLALVALSPAVRPALPVRRALMAAVGIAAIVGAGLSLPRLADAVHDPDPDLACVTTWVEQSGRTGAGQFWTVRLPKAHLDDPARLVQVDHRLDAYAWLVGRSDFSVDTVSFLVEDAQSAPWELPAGTGDPLIIECGRYRILDFGDELLSLGPEHS